MKKIVLASLAPIALLAACGGGDPAESVAAIRHTEQGQLDSIASGDLVGIARLYSDNAHLVKPDGTVLDGGVAIVEEYDRLLADPNFALTMEPLNGWASASDDLAVVTSKISFTTTDPETGEAVTMPLESQTVWQRATGSTWKIVSAYNVAVAPAAEAPAEVTDAAAE
ncbi:hypothetical protein GCM10009127_04830 [Alteraurantiacibacter aestuarii]|uniref:DUF4440 domain-containing protein n=1 Tax=Alteraurantiacibacter aestuarii TaxID=650004 RepID=A0A844ZN39_9SPHN|nr:nuclear transport factor 2 family protein [Alteraurantiacibacter aestuarii]MXO88267.1 DUF4440 domain-containing protein [Alteraurantiacibacter aestuarii]